MCEPITLSAAGSAIAGAASSAIAAATSTGGMAALSAGSAIVGHMGASQAARDQNRAYLANADSAIVAFQDDIEASNLDAMSTQEAATQRRLAASAEGLAARSASRVSAGERGAGGYSAAALYRDIGFQEGQNISAIDRNAELDDQRGRLRGRAINAGAQSRINSVRRARGPGLASLGLNLASTAVGAYTMGQRRKENLNGE